MINPYNASTHGTTLPWDRFLQILEDAGPVWVALVVVTHVARPLLLRARVPTPGTPSCVPLSNTPKSPPPTTTSRDFFRFLCHWMGAYRDFPSEVFPSEGLLFRFCLSLCFFSVSQGWIHFFSLPDGLCHLFGDHNPSSKHICCVIYDLEVSNDAYPKDANLTFVGEIFFP